MSLSRFNVAPDVTVYVAFFDARAFVWHARSEYYFCRLVFSGMPYILANRSNIVLTSRQITNVTLERDLCRGRRHAFLKPDACRDVSCLCRHR
jgi:hypothetical protein